MRKSDIIEREALRAQMAKTERRANKLREGLAAWVGKFHILTRWPCTECGRPNADAPLRTKEVHTASGRMHFEGCTACNVEALVQQTIALLKEDA